MEYRQKSRNTHEHYYSKLDSSLLLKLLDTVYVLSMRRNLVSVSKFVTYGHYFLFRMNKFDYFLILMLLGTNILNSRT